jgi:hypothetical protein
MKMLKEIFKPSLQVTILIFEIIFVNGKLITLYFLNISAAFICVW